MYFSNISNTYNYRDIDGTYWAELVINEGSKSSDFVCTHYTSSSMATVITNVNNHLTNSTKRLHDIKFFSGNIVTLTFHAVVIEKN